jgi:hypothetical protein
VGLAGTKAKDGCQYHFYFAQRNIRVSLEIVRFDRSHPSIHGFDRELSVYA